ncbi:MAG: hypothetical protein KatS3mg053_0599 [Candidatus Roseilinea sp.]|nr:MAG: hypothetical protein KatS3mg053_0599 [Candidatus Roseilinea sp.]
MSKRTSRRQFLRIASGTLAASALAACAVPAAPPTTGTGQQPSASEPSTVSEPTTAKGEKAFLKWDTFRGPGTGWNEERIKTFQEQYPNVEIEFRPLTGASQQDNYGKMYAQFAAGDLGDVIAFDPSHFHFWRAIDKGIIGPIDDLVAADKTDLKQWFDQFIELQYYKGKLYGLPSWGWAGQDTIVMNALHLKEAGITPPDPVGYDTSMETYAEWARRLYKKDERFGLGITYSRYAASVTGCSWRRASKAD